MNISKLHLSGKTVFSIRDIVFMLGISEQGVRNFLYKQGQKMVMRKISSGLWAINGKQYNKYEFATKLKKKSYISLETSLKDTGIIFQHYDSIFLVSDRSLEKIVDGQKYVYKKLQDSILLDPIGVQHKGDSIIAGKERAICDRLYFTTTYYFDSLEGVDFEKLEKISKIYNKRVQREVQQLIQTHAQ